MASQTPADGQGSTAIDDDVLYEILLRLPAKPLCRLRAVCQSWRSLLSTPSFITAHKAREAALLLVVREDAGSAVNVHVLDILSGKSVRQIRIENNSKRFLNSLALLMRPPHDLPLVRLPTTDSEGLRLRVLDLANCTDFTLPDDVDHDKQQPHCASFMVGRASTGAYKVLCIRSTFGPNADGQQLCRVLTLSGNHGWTDTGCPPAKIRTCRQDGAAVKGVAYFLLSTIGDPEGSNQCIVVYDLEKEAWRPASLPAPAPSNNQPRNKFFHSLVELGGCLAILYEDWYNAFKELWLLVDADKVIWSKRCTITVPYRYHGVEESLPRMYFAQILWLLDDGRIVIWMLVSGLAPSRVLCVYDPRTMTYTDVAHMPNYMLGCVYTGSLLG